MSWSVEISEFDIQYKPRDPMKTQFMADWWTLYVDGVSNMRGSKVRIILEGPDNITLEQALKLNFRASNN